MSDPSNPYGAPSNPYGQQPTNPYGASPSRPADAEGGQPPSYGAQQPYAGYGQPLTPMRDPDKRPGTVTAAGVVTLVFAGISLLLFVLAMIAIAVARDDIIDSVRDEPGLEDIDPDDLVTVLLIMMAVFVIWALAAMVLAVLAMRRSNVARILLVVSASMTALFSLLAITSVISALTLFAGIAVVILLFVGGAGDWYARRGQSGGQLPVGTTQPWS